MIFTDLIIELASAPINRRLSFNRSPQPINGLAYDPIEKLTFRRAPSLVAIAIGSAYGDIHHPGGDVARAFLESLY